MNAPVVRKLTEADVAAFRELRLEGLRNNPEAFGEDSSDFEKRTLNEIVVRLADAGDGSFVLGAFFTDICGCVGMARSKGTKSRHKGFIWGMYVRQSHQRRGVGLALMEHAIAQSKTIEGLEFLQLAVVTTNDSARRLYERLGFTVYGTDPAALKVDGRYFDEYLMQLQLR